jgi:transcription elongation GreA/GreB family factor
MSELKEQLHQLSRLFLDTNIRDIEAAIADRREAIAGETKSSMGDKYETTREMLQQDINMNIERLAKARLELAILDTISPSTISAIVRPGSLVRTTAGSFYIAISAGSVTISGGKYYIVSIASPIGAQLKGKMAGDVYTLNGRQYTIEKVL